MPERITHLLAPPIIGRSYLVPTVTFPWLRSDNPAPWPVFLPRHEDAEHLNFPRDHFHVDPRFLGMGAWRLAARWHVFWYTGMEPPDQAAIDQAAFAVAQSTPLNRRDRTPPRQVEWRRLVCKRAEIPFMHGDKSGVQSLRKAFAGQRCRSTRAGFVCPHRRFPLGSIAPVDGVITCPLHGLQIDAASGLVLSPSPQGFAQADGDSRG